MTEFLGEDVRLFFWHSWHPFLGISRKFQIGTLEHVDLCSFKFHQLFDAPAIVETLKGQILHKVKPWNLKNLPYKPKLLAKIAVDKFREMVV